MFPFVTRDAILKFPWLVALYDLVLKGRSHDALDILFSDVNEMCKRGDFVACDQMFAVVELDRLDAILLVGFLSITFLAKDKLPSRPAFVSRVRTLLVHSEGEERTRRLLVGLD